MEVGNAYGVGIVGHGVVGIRGTQYQSLFTHPHTVRYAGFVSRSLGYTTSASDDTNSNTFSRPCRTLAADRRQYRNTNVRKTRTGDCLSEHSVDICCLAHSGCCCRSGWLLINGVKTNDVNYKYGRISYTAQLALQTEISSFDLRLTLTRSIVSDAYRTTLVTSVFAIVTQAVVCDTVFTTDSFLWPSGDRTVSYTGYTMWQTILIVDTMPVRWAVHSMTWPCLKTGGKAEVFKS